MKNYLEDKLPRCQADTPPRCTQVVWETEQITPHAIENVHNYSKVDVSGLSKKELVDDIAVNLERYTNLIALTPQELARAAESFIIVPLILFDIM